MLEARRRLALCVDVVGEGRPIDEDECPLLVLENAADLSSFALTHGKMKEHGALCAEVVVAEEFGALLDEPLSPEVFGDRRLTPGLGEVCDDPARL